MSARAGPSVRAALARLYYNAIPGPRPAFRQVFRILGMDRLGWHVPSEFSPSLVAAFLVAIALFVRGQRVPRVTGPPQFLFWTGLVVLFMSLSHLTHYSPQRLCFIHRTQ